ncbi:MAG: hypothetical protein HPPSJP_2540 [Candidatus Hepatoplasma scabrum]|nr:MAG: hypothetical protein HPPSJP_2540 [Candidatus Hepatoplasma sp.]
MKKYKFFNFKIFSVFTSFLIFINFANINLINNKLNDDNLNETKIGDIITQVNGQQVYGEDFDQSYEATSGALVDADLDGFADTIYMWGGNSYGQLGINDQENEIVSTPQKIDTFKYGTGSFYELQSSGTHSGVIFDSDNDNKSDQLYMWGDNSSQELAINRNITENISIPVVVDFDWGGNIIELELAYGYSGVTVDTDEDDYADTLYMWGNNADGQIGNGEKENTILEPTLITPQDQDNWNGNILDFETDGHHTGVIIDTDYDGYADTLYMWGNNDYGQIGNGERTFDVTIPTMITPQGNDWNGNLIDLELGAYHSGVTVDTDDSGYADTLYMWGDNYFDQLGNLQSSGNTLVPLISYGPDQTWNGDIVDFSLSGLNSGTVIDTDNDHLGDKAYFWGDNNCGQIGNNQKTSGNENQSEISIPTSPLDQNGEEFLWNGNIVNLDLGGNSSSILIDTNYDGYGDDLYFWGDNDYGQLGNNEISKDQLTPVGQDFYLENFLLEDYQFYNTNNHQLLINIKLKDEDNIFNQDNIPDLKLKNQNDVYTTTYLLDNSNPEIDSYTFLINNTKTGTSYNFEKILINDQNDDFDQDKIFAIENGQIVSDYKIVSATIPEENISPTEVLLALKIENQKDFEISNFTNDQLKVRINYQDKDQEQNLSQETFINENKEILLTGLEVQKNYQVTSIDYFYEDSNYKYSLDNLNLNFTTNAVAPTFYDLDDTFVVNDVEENWFQFTVELDNVIFDQNGKVSNISSDIIFLFDDDNSYQAYYVENSWEEDTSQLTTANGSMQGYATFEVEELSAKTNYSFIGLSFDQSEENMQRFSQAQVIKTDKNVNYILIFLIIIGSILIILLLIGAFYLFRKYYWTKEPENSEEDFEILSKI